MNKIEFIKGSLADSAETKLKIERQCSDDILSAIDVLVGAFRRGNKLLLCGNGGSAADCQVRAI